MSWYQVVKPCVVGKLHYAKPTVQPIEVDDETAAPLVADGSLEPYPSVSVDDLADKARAAFGLMGEAVDNGGDVDGAADAAAAAYAEYERAASGQPKPETDDNKPRLVAWLLDNRSNLTEAELNRLTKPQLWSLINGEGLDGH